ncbi:LysR family transcriptional regulator [Desulfitobacterium chlororespirans]|uniref:DNA-binding transcriptional regulator, LysR family n=1 Tax=Desulfitobacterium chlororespirans DSM 11544 TaxID=1121395 RepID=A0A1M7SGT0_9FIRM|nr:LysR family transcriptional regulator [Desulfitobacterium chlororespirans]SHN57689.1 DNA-binding transcriptional regulator, LysR family [Desulfitobacterium chlororespirans DSM 11544]
MYLLGIEAFLAIVQTHSLSKAAEFLHLTQSTVSYRLKTLEQELGTSLVQRGKGLPAIALTPFGENFVAIAERWRALIRETELLQANGPQISLALGGSHSLNTYLLPSLYQALSRHTPPLRLQIRTQHSKDLYTALERREIDAAFVRRELIVPNVAVEPFFQDEMVLVRLSTPENSAVKRVAPSDLHGEDELYIHNRGWGSAYQSWHDRWWDPLEPPRIQIDGMGLIFALLQDSRQWALAPRSIAGRFVQSGQCVIQEISDPPPPIVHYKITHKYAPPASPGLKLLDRYLKDFFPAGQGGEQKPE